MRNGLQIAMIIALILISSGLNGQQDYRLLKAQQFLETENYTEAIEWFQFSIKKQESREALEGLITTYLKTKDYSMAAKWIQRLSEKGEYDPRFAFFMGHIQLSRSQPDSAKKWFLAYAQHSSDSGRGEGFAALAEAGADLNQGFRSTIQLLPFHTDADEFGPFPWKNGLIFCSNRAQDIAGVVHRSQQTHQPLQNLYLVTSKGEDQWNTPQPLGTPLNTRLNEGPACLSADSSLLYFNRGDLKKVGNQKVPEVSIWVSSAEPEGWGNPTKVPLSSMNAQLLHPSISADGEWLYFAAELPGGEGGYDLYRIRIGKGMGVPRNLGPEINTPFDEVFPYAHPSGTLYFASNGHPGYGGLDLFSATPDSREWETPKNLGTPINSPWDDLSLVVEPDGVKGYFASNRRRKGRGDDLYSCKMPIPEFSACQPQKKTPLCYKFTEASSLEELPYQLIYEWDFGDGEKSYGFSARHCYQEYGKYQVSLTLLDSVSREPLFVETNYELNLERQIQPLIAAVDSFDTKGKVLIDGNSSYLPGFSIKSWFWDLGNGFEQGGPEAEITLIPSDSFEVKLGLITERESGGEEVRFCTRYQVKRSPSQAKEPVATSQPEDIEPTLNKRYKILLGTAITRIPNLSANFKGLQDITELLDADLYRYYYGNYSSLDSAITEMLRIRKLGFYQAVLMTFQHNKLQLSEQFRNNWLPAEGMPFVTVFGFGPPGSILSWENLETGEKVQTLKLDPTTGRYQINLKQEARYGAFLQEEGHVPQSLNVDLREYTGPQTLQMDIELVSIEEMIRNNTPIRLNNFFFGVGNYKLTPESHLELDRMAGFLKENPNIFIEISGHTDNSGRKGENLKLSRLRAEEVAEYLNQRGVPASQMSSVGYGETRPEFSNDELSGRQKNRRVEFRILSKD